MKRERVHKLEQISTAFAIALALGAATLPAQEEGDEWNVSWDDGTRIESKDGDFKIKIGGRLQADSTFIVSQEDVFEDEDGDDLFQDGSEFRRARLFIEGTLYGNIGFKVQYDFAGGAPAFNDVWLAFHRTPVGRIQIGHFKEPFSIGALTSSNYIAFLERALPNLFAPGRNTGIGFSGSRDRFNWGAGIFRETDNFGLSFGNDNTNLTGRVVWRPIYQDDGRRLLHVAVGATTKESAGVSDDARFQTRLEFNQGPRQGDTGPFPNDGEDILGLELAAVSGPFWFSGEYIHPVVEAIIEPELAPLPSTASEPLIERVEFPGFYASAGFYLTGEHRRYRTSIVMWDRQRPNNILGSGGGAWEIALRYSKTDLTDGRIIGGELDAITLALNWYPNSATRLMVNYIASTIQGVGDVDALVLRAQIDF